MKKNFSIIKSYVVIAAFFLLNIGSIKAQNGPVCDTYKNVGATVATGFPSGRVNGVVASGSTVYVATANGLSISSDGFATFTNKTTANGLGDNWINDIYAYGNTVYAATGSGWSMDGGLSISTDGGATFTNKTTANGLGDNAVNGVYAIGSTVYAATGSDYSNGGGLSISTDGGATFTNKTTANGLGSNYVMAVFTSGNTIYAATYPSYDYNTNTMIPGGLSISTDGGATFTNKTTENGLGNNTVNGVYAIGSTVYAATTGGLSISTDGGSSFTNITTENGLGNNTVNGVYAIGSTVYAATTGGLSISTDGGSTFTNYTTANGLGYNSLNGIYASGNSVYAATDDGLSISTNGGTSFTNLSERRPTNNGYATDKTYGVSVSGNTIFASTEKGLSISTNGGTTFSTKTTANGLGTDVLYNAVQVVGSTIYAPTNAGLSISTDGGASFTTKTTANGLGSNYLTSVFVSGNNVYVTSYGGLSISTNGGESFINKTTADGLANNNVRGVHVMGNTLYVATQFGLSISTDGGTTFSNKTTANGLASNYVFAVYATESKLYVACDVGLSISTDGGATFTNKTTANGLGSNGIYNVFVIGSTVYASTGDGLSISTDGGASFTNYNNTNGLGSNAYYGATVYGSVAVSGNTLYVPTYGGLSFCSVCSPPTEGGTIAGTQSLCSPANPAAFTSDALPSGQTGTLEYQWQSSTDNSTFSDIVGASASTYDAPSGLTTTTYYKRLARVDCQTDWSGAVASNVVTVTVITTASPTAAEQTFCGSKTVADLLPDGTDLKWYNAASNGTALTNTDVLVTGTYYVSQTQNNCESDRTAVTVTVHATTGSAQTVSQCGVYTWPTNNQLYTQSGTYTVTLTNAAGCDSTVTLNLTINNATSGSETVSNCGAYTWAANGQTYTQSGTYTATLTNAAGCDSTVTLNLTVKDATTVSETISNCGAYTWTADNQTYTQSGTYTATLTNAAGCDSTVTLNLTIKEATTGSETVSNCGSYTWAADGQTYTQSGTYTTLLTNAAGCDSTVTLNLTINNPSANSESVTSCGEYTWAKNGTTYTQSGTYSFVLTNAAGCDSTLTLNLTINELPTASVSTSSPTTVCRGTLVPLNANTGDGLTYLWRKNNTIINGATNATYSVINSGFYEVEVTHSNGCKKSSAKTRITVNTIPAAGAISGGNYVCKGTSIKLTPTVAGGVWSVLKPTLASIDQNGNVTGLMKTNQFTSDVVAYTVTNIQGCSATVKRGLGIDSLPVVPIISGPDKICSNGTALYRCTNLGSVSWTAGPLLTASSAYKGVFTHRVAQNGAVPSDNFATSINATSYSANKVCSSTVTKNIQLRTIASKAFTITAPTNLTVNAPVSVSASSTNLTTLNTSNRFWLSNFSLDLSVSSTTALTTTIKALRVPTETPKLYFSATETSTGCGITAYKQFTVTAASSLVDANSTQTTRVNGVHLYPNPSNGKFTIENTDGATSVKLVDLSGRVIATQPITSGTATVDFSGVATGKYMVHISGETINEVQPIVIE